IDGLPAGARIGARLFGPLFVLIGAGCGTFMIARLELPAAAIAVPVVLVVAGAVISARARIPTLPLPPVPWIALAAMTVTYARLLVYVMPALEARRVIPDVARWVQQHTSSDDHVAIYRLNRWSSAFRFYVDRPTPHLESAAEAREFLTGHRR